MAQFNMCYYRFFGLLIATFICNAHMLFGQGNCLLYPENCGERIACELSYRAIAYVQGSKESQYLFDQAIKIGPKYAWAYYEKSVPFFKRGLFAEGVSLINKAIELEPKNYLYYRAYWYFYNASYDFCIRDLEDLYSTYEAPYTTTPGGEKEMRLILALAYSETGRFSRAIYWTLDLLDSYKERPHLRGDYDHYFLGVLYYKNNQFDLAELEFQKQLKSNDRFADTYYYLGLIHKRASKTVLAEKSFMESRAKLGGQNGGYTIPIFEGFNATSADIEKEIQKG